MKPASAPSPKKWTASSPSDPPSPAFLGPDPRPAISLGAPRPIRYPATRRPNGGQRRQDMTRSLRMWGAAALVSALSSVAAGDIITGNFSAGVGVGTAFGGTATTQYKTFGFTMP